MWMVRADMTERLCGWDYMTKEFHIPNWLGSLDACKELIEAMRKERFNFILESHKAEDWECTFVHRDDDRTRFTVEPTPERAICHAFLEHHGKWQV